MPPAAIATALVVSIEVATIISSILVSIALPVIAHPRRLMEVKP